MNCKGLTFTVLHLLCGESTICSLLTAGGELTRSEQPVKNQPEGYSRKEIPTQVYIIYNQKSSLNIMFTHSSTKRHVFWDPQIQSTVGVPSRTEWSCSSGSSIPAKSSAPWPHYPSHGVGCHCSDPWMTKHWQRIPRTHSDTCVTTSSARSKESSGCQLASSWT